MKADEAYGGADVQQGPITVVAIDDHPTYVHGLKTLLSASTDDISVVAVATSPEEGISLVCDHRPAVVLLDLHMPRLEGLQVTRRIKDMSPGTNVLILTASDEVDDVGEVMRSGANGFLQKEIEPDDLAAAIRTVAAGEVVLAPFAAAALLGTGSEPRLSEYEMKLVRLISTGESYSSVASKLAISESTLKRQLADVQRKLGVQNKIEAVAYLAKRGLL